MKLNQRGGRCIRIQKHRTPNQGPLRNKSTQAAATTNQCRLRRQQINAGRGANKSTQAAATTHQLRPRRQQINAGRDATIKAGHGANKI